MKPQVVPVDTTQKVVFTNFWRFGQKFEKFSLKNRKNSEKKQKKLFFPQFLFWAPTQKLENHAKCFCRKSITIQNFRKKNQATNCSSGHVEDSFDNFLKFFGRKSEKCFAQNPKEFWEEKSENCFFRTFYSGHVNRNLRTMPKVSAENPNWFKSFKKFFKPQIVPLDTQKVVLTTFWIIGQKSEKFSLKNRNNSEKKQKKTVFSAIFNLDS